MKRTFYTIIIVLLHLFAFSQNISITIGNEKIKWLEFARRFVGSDNQGFYTADYSEDLSSNFTLTKYSSTDINTLYSQKIKVPTVNDKECLVKTILLVENTLVLFTTQYDKNNNLNKLYANKFNSDGSINPDSKLIAEIKAIDKKTKGFFRLSVSESKKSIIVLSEQPSSETDNIRYEWKVIDKDLNTLWDKSVNLPYYGISSDLIVKMEYKNDKIYFIATNLKDISIKDRKNAKAENKLYCYDLKQSKLTEVILNIRTKSLFDLNINLNDKNQVILTGLYSFSKVLDKQVFFNKTNELRDENGAFCSIYSENLTEILYNDSIENKTDGYLYYVNDVFVQNDGTVIFVSENKNYSGNQGGTPDYNSGGVLIHAFNPINKTKWIKKIEKSQHDVVERYLFSTISLANNNSLALLINDNIKNTLTNTGNNSNKFIFENFQIEKNAITKIIQLDTKENIKENTTVKEFSNAENVVHCNIKTRISPNEIIVSVKTEGGNKYAKITFK